MPRMPHPGPLAAEVLAAQAKNGSNALTDGCTADRKIVLREHFQSLRSDLEARVDLALNALLEKLEVDGCVGGNGLVKTSQTQQRSSCPPDRAGVQSPSHLEGSVATRTVGKDDEEAGQSTQQCVMPSVLARQGSDGKAFPGPCTTFENQVIKAGKISIANEASSFLGKMWGDADDHWRQRIRRNYGTQYLEPVTSVAKNRRRIGEKVIQKIVKSKFFEFFSMTLVFTNTGFLVWQLQVFARSQSAVMENADAAEIAFMVAFSLELLMVMASSHVCTFFTGPDWKWHAFDTIIVGSMWLEFALEEISQASPAVLQHVSMFRVLRVLRVLRILRVIRVLRFFRQLRIMLSGIISSLPSLVWTLIVLLMMFFIFGYILTQGIAQFCEDNDAWHSAETESLRTKYGSLDLSILSLYEAMAGGVSWGEHVAALRQVNEFYVYTFLVFITIAIFAVGNIVTGVFVEHAIAHAQKDNSAVIQDAMLVKETYVDSIKNLFAQMDSDQTGILSRDAFKEGIQDVRLLAYFDGLGLDIHDARTLFVLLDRDQTGTIDIEEFLTGCLKLKGEAKAIDMHKMMYQVESLCHSHEKLTKVMSLLCSNFNLEEQFFDIQLSPSALRASTLLTAS